jgi:hypothetical protein
MKKTTQTFVRPQISDDTRPTVDVSATLLDVNKTDVIGALPLQESVDVLIRTHESGMQAGIRACRKSCQTIKTSVRGGALKGFALGQALMAIIAVVLTAVLHGFR